MKIEWWVTNEVPSPSGFPWKYTYKFSHNGTQAGYSHAIIEASDDITLADITQVENAQNVSATLQTVASGNPNMPEDLIGIRFHPPQSGMFVWEWSFFSNRQPVWGDFYGRCGGFMGGINHAYNYNMSAGGFEAGFLDPDNSNTVRDDPDPTAPASNGSVDFHILRPDSVGGGEPVIPEPCSMLLLGGGLAGLVAGRLRGRRRAMGG